jgi:hypothetical protein
VTRTRPAARPAVVYVAGAGRSGSTLVDQILGAVDGWFSCGELRYLWRNFLCSCGAPVFECALWAPVLEQTRNGSRGVDPAALAAVQQEHLDVTRLAAIARIARERRRASSGGSSLALYAQAMSDLYATISAATGARVVVDSSKLPTDLYLLSTLTSVDLYVLHLVRDPRATAFSWSRTKERVPGHYFHRLGPWESSFYWLRRNGVVDGIVRPRLRERYLRVRYEDFVARPEEAVRSICSLVGKPVARLPFVDDHTVELQPNHMVAGNPSRFTSGRVSIHPDDAWRSAMSRRDRVLASLPAAALMRRYGYDLRAERGTPP